MVLFEIHQNFKGHLFNKLRITFNLEVRAVINIITRNFIVKQTAFYMTCAWKM